MKDNEKVVVILLAGGTGTRMQSDIPKQFLPLKGKPLAIHSFELFQSLPMVSEIVVVCDPSYVSLFNSNVVKTTFAIPGNRRQDSMENGLRAIQTDTNYVCIHDSARPLIKIDDVKKVIAEGIKHGAATLAVPLKFTIKQADHEGFVVKTIDRSQIWEIQTPQVLNKKWLLEGLEVARQKNIEVTDDVSFAELINVPVKIVKGCYKNFKVTTPEDLHVANQFMSHAEL